MSGAEWEYEWSPEKKRYYYMDKAEVEKNRVSGARENQVLWQVSGRSSWSRPAGCSVDLPDQPPQEEISTSLSHVCGA